MPQTKITNTPKVASRSRSGNRGLETSGPKLPTPSNPSPPQRTKILEGDKTGDFLNMTGAFLNVEAGVLDDLSEVIHELVQSGSREPVTSPEVSPITPAKAAEIGALFSTPIATSPATPQTSIQKSLMHCLGLISEDHSIRDASSITFAEWLNMISGKPRSNVGGIICDHSRYEGDYVAAAAINCQMGESETELYDVAELLSSNIRSVLSDIRSSEDPDVLYELARSIRKFENKVSGLAMLSAGREEQEPLNSLSNHLTDILKVIIDLKKITMQLEVSPITPEKAAETTNLFMKPISAMSSAWLWYQNPSSLNDVQIGIARSLGLVCKDGSIRDASSIRFKDWINLMSGQLSDDIGSTICTYANYNGDFTVASVINCEGDESTSGTELSDAARGLLLSIRSAMCNPDEIEDYRVLNNLAESIGTLSDKARSLALLIPNKTEKQALISLSANLSTARKSILRIEESIRTPVRDDCHCVIL